MHAHQSKAPRATLQHTHTYSTHSTAGTDQFILMSAGRYKHVLHNNITTADMLGEGIN